SEGKCECPSERDETIDRELSAFGPRSATYPLLSGSKVPLRQDWRFLVDERPFPKRSTLEDIITSGDLEIGDYGRTEEVEDAVQQAQILEELDIG
ncbi:hypothetical protein PoB_005953100, partial [Plakobranchus ocellatus]